MKKNNHFSDTAESNDNTPLVARKMSSDEFSDVFQGSLVEVTKAIMNNVSLYKTVEQNDASNHGNFDGSVFKSVVGDNSDTKASFSKTLTVNSNETESAKSLFDDENDIKSSDKFQLPSKHTPVMRLKFEDNDSGEGQTLLCSSDGGVSPGSKYSAKLPASIEKTADLCAKQSLQMNMRDLHSNIDHERSIDQSLPQRHQPQQLEWDSYSDGLGKFDGGSSKNIDPKNSKLTSYYCDGGDSQFSVNNIIRNDGNDREEIYGAESKIDGDDPMRPVNTNSDIEMKSNSEEVLTIQNKTQNTKIAAVLISNKTNSSTAKSLRSDSKTSNLLQRRQRHRKMEISPPTSVTEQECAISMNQEAQLMSAQVEQMSEVICHLQSQPKQQHPIEQLPQYQPRHHNQSQYQQIFNDEKKEPQQNQNHSQQQQSKILSGSHGVTGLARRQKIASRVASGKVHLLKVIANRVASGKAILPAAFEEDESELNTSTDCDDIEAIVSTEGAETCSSDALETEGAEESFLSTSDISTSNTTTMSPSSARRRQKMAERIASGKVPVPKALLGSQPLRNIKHNAVSTSFSSLDSSFESLGDEKKVGERTGNDISEVAELNAKPSGNFKDSQQQKQRRLRAKRNNYQRDYQGRTDGHHDRLGPTDCFCDVAKELSHAKMYSDSALLHPPPPPPTPPPTRVASSVQAAKKGECAGLIENDSRFTSEDVEINEGRNVEKDALFLETSFERTQVSQTSKSNPEKSDSHPNSKRRQKMAERLASGKVPIPKALLEAQPLRNIKNNAASLSFSLDATMDSADTMETCENIFSTHNTTIPTNDAKHCSDALNSPLTPPGNNPSSSPLTRLLISPTEEVEIEVSFEHETLVQDLLPQTSQMSSEGGKSFELKFDGEVSFCEGDLTARSPQSQHKYISMNDARRLRRQFRRPPTLEQSANTDVQMTENPSFQVRDANLETRACEDANRTRSAEVTFEKMDTPAKLCKHEDEIGSQGKTNANHNDGDDLHVIQHPNAHSNESVIDSNIPTSEKEEISEKIVNEMQLGCDRDVDEQKPVICTANDGMKFKLDATSHLEVKESSLEQWVVHPPRNNDDQMVPDESQEGGLQSVYSYPPSQKSLIFNPRSDHSDILPFNTIYNPSNAETGALFPLDPIPLVNPSHLQLVKDAAWNVDFAPGMNDLLDASKAITTRALDERNGSTQPLLQLEMVTSDGCENDVETEAKDSALSEGRITEAAEKLLSQKERMDMYADRNGFGVGDDSSCENESAQVQSESDGSEEKCMFEPVGNGDSDDIVGIVDMPSRTVVSEDGNDREANGSYDAFDFTEFGKGSYDENFTTTSGPSFHINPNETGNHDHRWNQNPDAISDAGDESNSGATKSSITGDSAVFGIRFVESTQESNEIPTPPQSQFEPDLDATPKMGTKEISRADFIQEEFSIRQSKAPKVFKIPPPPPEKLRHWEESGSRAYFFENRLTTGQALQQCATSEIDVGTTSPTLRDNNTNYKINIPKSPAKRHPHSISEELNLCSHKRMAEKIAIASSKAAKKFEEEYSFFNVPSEQHDSCITPRVQSTRSVTGESLENSPSMFFCASESVIADSNPLKQFIPGHNSETVDQPKQPVITESPTLSQDSRAIELVRGAFSPWKIPDQTEEDSNASSSRLTYDDETYANATAAALAAIHGHLNESETVDFEKEGNTSKFHGLPLPYEDVNIEDIEESFELNLDMADVDVSSFDGDTQAAGYDNEIGGLLTDVLQWLFDDVLSANSSIATAFSAFDIETSTPVQAARVFAIANDDESFNVICHHVANVVMRLHGHKICDADQRKDSLEQIIHASSSEDVSVSTYASSNVTSIYDSSVGASSFSENKSSFSQKAAARIFKGKKRIEPFKIPTSKKGDDATPHAEVLAANFVSFLQQISHIIEVPSPLGKGNPFLQSVVNLTTKKHDTGKKERKKMQELVFADENNIVQIFKFLLQACKGDLDMNSGLPLIEEHAYNEGENEFTNTSLPITDLKEERPKESIAGLKPEFEALVDKVTTKRKSQRQKNANRGTKSRTLPNKESQRASLNLIFPKLSPSPFELAVWNDPSIILSILSFLGNPVAVCVMKRLNVFCNRVVSENEHVLMRDAVRLGGLNMYVRPAFWLWVMLEKCKPEDSIPLVQTRRGFDPNAISTSTSNYNGRDFSKLKDKGAAGKWQHIIERDVTRAFGNMPPHKTGARYRQDSIVRALVSFGKEGTMRNNRSFQGLDRLPEESEASHHYKMSSGIDRCLDDTSNGSISLAPTDTVSDWGGISPVGSMASEEPSAGTAEESKFLRIVSYEGGQFLEANDKHLKLNTSNASKSDVSDLVLSGSALTSEMKVDLQNKLRSILHALAAIHEGVGYCQGMDYVVAHLLRVLQDTILLRVIQGSIPVSNELMSNGSASTDWRKLPADELRSRMNDINTQSCIVEEIVFRVMDTFFTTYNLQHMYWPELRCLKTCCRVFEKLIKQKLPVLADHFEHHDLNVGLFALGWFQTLFLYLPSMPSVTVCHMWDIWLVERSFKIFFRVGTAILFLSQPTLLNHDLEGMMTYLNTFPDATLLRRDILIPCALQIKITNRMLVEIEMDVINFHLPSHDSHGEAS